jgi:glycogen synthase
LNALRRAVETPWTIVSEMGYEASQNIRKICDNSTILTAQLEFRRRLVGREANRSLHLPKSLTLPRDDRTSVRKKTTEQKKPPGGIGIVVAACGGRTSLGRCINGIERQSRKPTAVAIVYNRWTSFWAGSSLRRARKQGWQLIRSGDFGFAGYRAWTQAILSHGSEPTAVVFLGSVNKLRPEFVATSEAILERCPEIGVVSCWAMRSGRIWIRPCPSFPYQWLCNDAVPFSAIRVEALKEIFRLGHDDESNEGNWKLVNSVMAAGWMAVTVPEVLADGNPSIRKPPYDLLRSAKASFEILSSKHSDLLLQKPDQIQSLLESESPTRWEILIARHAEFENTVYALHHPIKTIRWLLRQTWSRRKRFDGFA